MAKRISVRYLIIAPICLLVAACNYFVTNALAGYIADSQSAMFTDKNVTNIKTIIPTLALSLWEFNDDRVASILTGIDDGDTFLFASVLADGLEFSFRGNRIAYERSVAALKVAPEENIGQSGYLIHEDVLIVFFPIAVEKNNYTLGQIVAGFELSNFLSEQKSIIYRVNSIAAFATGIVLLGIVVFSWFANHWLSKVASSITDIANGQLKNHNPLNSPITEFHDIDLALDQLIINAVQLIEFETKAKSDEKIRHMAMHDALTGLANRRYLDEFKTALTKTWRPQLLRGNWLEVLHIDLDDFKHVNDNFGHAAGDRVLQIASKRLQKHTASLGRVFRVGGDEFVIVRLHKRATAEKNNTAYPFVQRITEALREPYLVDGHTHTISASVGLVIFDGKELDFDTLLTEADIAMYQAKAAGKNYFVDFSPELRRRHSENNRLSSELKSALATGQIQAYYQPKVCSGDYSLCGAEALARWVHPQLGVLAPDKFLTVAKNLGLLAELDRVVFRKVCKDLECCRAKGYQMPMVSLNVSSDRLTDPHLLDELRNANLEADTVSFELQESTYYDEGSDDAYKRIESIRELGIKIELDDFGSGRASMIGLLKIAPDRLKIDRCFAKNMLISESSENMISKIIGIGNSLNIPSTAEGIENEQQALRLANLGCDNLQGFFFGKPCDYLNFVKEYVVYANTNTGKVPLHSADDDWLWRITG